MKYKTLVFDSGTELARLAFARDMRKTSSDMEKFPAINNYPGATERLAILFRRFKDLRDMGGEYKGYNIYVTANEQIERDYPKSAVGGKGEAPPEPITIKGIPDFPGKALPESIGRSCDNVLRMRWYQGKGQIVAIRQPIGVGASCWEVKDRMGLSQIQNGLFEPDWSKIQALAKDNDSYITMIYGAYGVGKTRLITTFPKPIFIFSIDRGLRTIKQHLIPGQIDYKEYGSEEGDDYMELLADLEAKFTQ